MDTAFNLLVLTADAAVVWLAAGDRPWSHRLASWLAWFAFALTLAALLGQGGFHLLRLGSFLLFVHLPAVALLMGALTWRRSARVGILLACVSLLSASTGTYAFLIEPTWLDVSTYLVTSSKLEHPVRIAVVADLQTDRVGTFERRVLAELATLRPDIILLPGDFVQESDPQRRERTLSELRELLLASQLRASLGIFATRGNVDAPGWARLFEGLPVTTFSTTASTGAGEILVTGLSLADSFDPELEIPADDRFHIVMGHAPDFALGDARGDLLIAGHTHGGQVRLPWIGPILTLSAVPRAWAAGKTRLSSDAVLVVSRGLGMERGRAPRLRFGCRPELVLINVVPAPAS